MQIVIEKSIQELVLKELEEVSKNWAIVEWREAIMNPLIVDNILSLPCRQVDFMAEDSKRWAIIMPIEPGTLFVLDYHLHEKDIACYCGGALKGHDPRFNKDDLISVIVFGNEKPKVLELRIVHELLHGLDLPSDDLQKYSDQAFQWYILYLYHLFQKLGVAAEHIPFFQNRFYRWLLISRRVGLM